MATVEPHSSAPADALEGFSLREASRLYGVELATLRNMVRRARIDAYKARGPWGREWRVTRATLEAMGYGPRAACRSASEDDKQFAHLERELRAARRTAAAERSRADEVDRRLGEALMESGRLRAALLAVVEQVGRDELPAVDMVDLDEALLDRRARPPAP